LKNTTLYEPIPELQENNGIKLEIKEEEEVISMIDVLTQQPNMAINYHPNENEILHHSSVSSLPVNDSSYEHPSFSFQSTKAIIEF
jgi:hypothetical protein